MFLTHYDKLWWMDYGQIDPPPPSHPFYLNKVPLGALCFADDADQIELLM